MPRLFGTDGIRGVANRDLTPDLALAVGRSAGRVLAPGGGEVVVGRDTRLSGPMLEGALVAGLCSAGANVRTAGIIPTPAIAFLTLEEKAQAGAVISASHNPVADNGIKFFSSEGLKVPADLEDEIERLMSEPGDLPVGYGVGRAESLEDAEDRYVEHLLESVGSLNGLRLVLDCAFGAAWNVGPAVFRGAGADVIALHAEPDGSRINVDCGSTSLQKLATAVVAEGAELGIALDGDADRALAIDEHGRTVDGDSIVGLFAILLHEVGELDNGLVVVTVMANLGLTRALEDRGIEVVAAPVGDKFVAEAMADRGAMLGGEQSGHVIFARHATTGDGLLTGLKVAEVVASSGKPLSQVARVFEPYPQVLISVPVDSGDKLDGADGLWEEVRAAEESLGADGRVLVRSSGTENVVRVMVEAVEQGVAQATAESLAAAVRHHLG